MGQVRRETFNGRDYLVAPMTLIVPGVLNGSEGPLYYPPEEIAKDCTAWNGMPIVVAHPVRDGQNVSARDPAILNESGVGYVYRTTCNDKLAAEGWFDVEKTRAVDPRVLSALEQGRPMEISTGLFTENTPADKGATYNGTPYTHIARNYKPDHLAVLPDEQGACSVKDGCGLLVNQSNGEIVMKLNTNQRKTIIDRMVKNCKCDKGKTPLDKGILEKLPDAKLYALNMLLMGNAEGDPPADGAPSVDTGELAKFFGVDIDPANDPAGFIKALIEKMDMVRTKLVGDVAPAPEPMDPAGTDEVVASAEDDPEKKKKEEMMLAANRVKRKPTAQEWLASAPPEIQSVVRNALVKEREEKLRLVERLTANVAEDRREAHAKKLAGKPLDELRELLELMPETPFREDDILLNFSGAAGAAHTSPRDDSANLLPESSFSFAEMASTKLRKQA